MTMTNRREMVLAGIAAVAVAGAFGEARAQQAQGPQSVLVDVEWLASHLEDPGLVILQVGPEEQYRSEHIAGSRFVTLADLERPMPADGPHDEHLALELPEWDVLRGTLEGLGISDDSRIVVVPASARITGSARVMFTLDAAGLGGRSHFLDGGLEAWKAAGHPVTAEVPQARPGTLRGSPAERVVRTEWVLEGNALRDGFALLDARAGAHYDGVRADRGKEGHIAGARNLHWATLWNEEDAQGAAYIKSREELRALFAAAGVEEGDVVVAYCHIGQYATGVLLAARVLGHEVRLYDGSMNEWALLDLPVEAGPGGPG
jgi:thiosulfate/3-mercaptopyruvate sulfurtransferase